MPFSSTSFGLGETQPALPVVLVPASQALLDPERLASAAEGAARALLRQGEAANTRLSYGSAMRYWCAWYAARYGHPLTLPVAVPVVVQFIVDHAARLPDAAPAGTGGKPAMQDRLTASGYAGAAAALVTELPARVDEALVAAGYKARLGPPALNTLVHRIAVLSKAHQMAQAGGGRRDTLARLDASAGGGSGAQAGRTPDLPNPCADPLVRELLARTRRAYAQRGARPRKQRALTKSPLQALLDTCDDSPRGVRDRALLLFAWATGGRRRSEVASSTLDKLHRVDAQSFVYTLAHSKSNQRGEERPEDVKPLVGTAADAMQKWLELLRLQGIREGGIFRRVRRGGHIGEPLAPAAVRDIVQERCVLAGMEGAFSAHSLRSGFVTEAGRRNMPLSETMAMTGHHSLSTVLGYFRAEGSVVTKVSRMLDEDGS